MKSTELSWNNTTYHLIEQHINHHQCIQYNSESERNCMFMVVKAGIYPRYIFVFLTKCNQNNYHLAQTERLTSFYVTINLLLSEPREIIYLLEEETTSYACVVGLMPEKKNRVKIH